MILSCWFLRWMSLMHRRERRACELRRRQHQLKLRSVSATFQLHMALAAYNWLIDWPYSCDNGTQSKGAAEERDAAIQGITFVALLRNLRSAQLSVKVWLLSPVSVLAPCHQGTLTYTTASMATWTSFSTNCRRIPGRRRNTHRRTHWLSQRGTTTGATHTLMKPEQRQSRCFYSRR